MPFGWFSTKDIDQFADAVLVQLQERFPHDGVDLSTKKSAERAMKNLERLYASIGEFAAAKRPSLYQKARFGNRIRWGLKDAGYPDQFVEVVTHEFVKQMAVSASARSKRGA